VIVAQVNALKAGITRVRQEVGDVFECVCVCCLIRGGWYELRPYALLCNDVRHDAEDW